MSTDAPDHFDRTIPEEGHQVLGGQFEVIRKLGEGGMGEVHLARDRNLDDRLVAVKLLPALRASSPRAMKQLRSEAATMAELAHPNIVRFYHFGDHEGTPFIVMQYIEGQTLDDLLGEHDTLDPGEIIELFEPIASALDYAHGAGVIHRDLKPSNIFIDQAGKPFLADFGLARVAKDTITQVTGRDTTQGTLMYMSPEQCRGERKLTASCDIYALATMLYECLEGVTPFSTGPIRTLILEEDPPLPEVDGPLVDRVMQGLSKAAEDRPGSCGELLGSEASAESSRSPLRRVKTPSTLSPQGSGVKPRSAADLADLESRVRILAMEAKAALEDGEALPSEHATNYERAGHFVESAKENKSARLWSDAAAVLERAAAIYEEIKAARVAADQAEAERIEAERVEAERVEAERVEAERVEAERVEQARIETERLEIERHGILVVEARRKRERVRETALSISSGGFHNAVIQPDGSVVCWGYNEYGRCNSPALLERSVRQIAAGGRYTVAVRDNGDVVCWGRNDSGEWGVPEGLGATVNPIIQVSVGVNHTAALLKDGQIVCWGDNSSGQCVIPLSTSDSGSAIRVAAGESHTVAVFENGSIHCWGRNNDGQCDVPRNLDTSKDLVITAAVGSDHTAALLANGSVVCWGRNDAGQCDVPREISVPGNLVTGITAGAKHTIALRVDGSLACWGDNSARQCDVPSDITKSANRPIDVVAGAFHTVAVLSDGSVRCWGANNFGQCSPPEGLRVRLPE